MFTHSSFIPKVAKNKKKKEKSNDSYVKTSNPSSCHDFWALLLKELQRHEIFLESIWKDTLSAKDIEQFWAV